MEYPEIVAVGIYDSKYAAKNVSISKNRKTSMFELELPLCKGGVSYIEGESTPIRPEVLICAKPGQARHTRFPYECYYVHMVVNEGTVYDMLTKLPNFFETEKREQYEVLFRKLCKHYDFLEAREEILVQSLILELIYALSEDTKNYRGLPKTVSSRHGMIEDTLHYIKENLTEDLSLENLCRRAHVSPIHFHHCFKSAVGMTLREFVEEQRIKKAINLLLTTEETLTEIAFSCGFSSQSYFSYVFKRRMKTTPRKYVWDYYHRYEL